MATAWSRAFYEGGGHYLVVKQLLHWLAIAVALGVDFYIRGSGQETGMASGFNAALLLALGCFLAGIHLEWIFSFVGVLLVLVLVAVVKADQYLWLIVIIAVACVAGMLGVMSLLAKSKQRKEAARSDNPPKA
jgi:general stress protein CsbA